MASSFMYAINTPTEVAPPGGGVSPPASNGRPWFVFYNAAAVEMTHIGGFMVPFEPSNEFEELYLQSVPWLYREFPTWAKAEAWVNSKEGQHIKHVQEPLPGAHGNLGNLPGLAEDLAKNPLGVIVGAITQRETWIRIGEGTLGVLLIAMAVNHLINPEQTLIQTAAKVVK